MFNSFLTFSAADGHWDDLHKLLPGHEEYLGKRVVKSLDMVKESECENCITEARDYILRKKAVDQNQDIVNEFFIKRVDTMWSEVLQPIFGGEFYIMRYEFQHRGTIHCHMVMSMENGPNHHIMELARLNAKIPEQPKWTTLDDRDCDTPEEKAEKQKEMQERYEKQLQENNDIVNAKEKMIEFTALVMGVYGVHPEMDFEEWPSPYGKNPYRPEKNVLRESFTDHIEDPEALLEYWTRLVNRVQLHKCKPGGCSSGKIKTVKDPKTGEKVKQRQEDCRFGFPFPLNGFQMVWDYEKGMLEGYDVDIQNDGDTLGDPLHYGASYKKATGDPKYGTVKLPEVDVVIPKKDSNLNADKTNDVGDESPTNEELAEVLSDEEMNCLIEEVDKEKLKLSESISYEKVNTKLELLRNHPALNNHIGELLILWGANVDQKCIQSYEHLRDYLLKYVLKPEKISDFFTRLARVIGRKVDDTTSLNKIAQKVLMNCIGQRDMSSNECFLIAHGKPYVKFSHNPRVANLKGSHAAKKKVKKATDAIHDDDDWQNSYWKKEEIVGYKKLCTDYENGEIAYLDKHPKYLSLREFMVTFTKKWQYCPAKVWPHFIPTFRYTVRKGNKMYEDYCQNLLLQDKPGCTLDNVGKIDIDGNKFENCEAELSHFVENSEYCPYLVKEEFRESQIPTDDPAGKDCFERC